MLSSTLEEGLRNYEIGDKVRALRLRKKMALVELGRHTGLSAALLSKIERSNIYPPLPTLLRIAMVFGVGLDYFFADESKRPVISIVRRKERTSFPDTLDGKVSYFFESLDFNANERKLNAYHAEFQTDPKPRSEVASCRALCGRSSTAVMPADRIASMPAVVLTPFASDSFQPFTDDDRNHDQRRERIGPPPTHRCIE